jgi:hypothetical protein
MKEVNLDINANYGVSESDLPSKWQLIIKNTENPVMRKFWFLFDRFLSNLPPCLKA